MMIFDWKKILNDSGIVLSVAEMARDKIVEGINKELERHLEEARNEVMTLKMDLQRVKLDLRISLEDAHRLNTIIDELRAKEAK